MTTAIQPPGPGHTRGKTAAGTNQALPPASCRDIIVSAPAIKSDDWISIDVAVITGLAMIGGPIRVVIPDGLGLRVLDAYVAQENLVRVRFQNVSGRAYPGGEFPVRFYAMGRRRSLFPEVNFDSLKEVKI